ncbi:transposase [Desulfosporosinus sp. HMP52]|uniref:IS66 family transposase n=1 Tax=Desulfosporosinus sp. HMP52 TaxID=1487923 RepID=UPI001FA760EB|nr:transposase [Desulfosporosinus sp. HMP52]
MNPYQEPLKKALRYTLKHREYFTNFLLDGCIPISNNLSELIRKLRKGNIQNGDDKY